MKPKKNPKKDLRKDSPNYFAFGMMLVLMLTYAALEWKTFYNSETEFIEDIAENELIEEVPITYITPPPKPPPPVAPTIIEIIKDDDPIEETDIIDSDPIEPEIYEPDDIPDIDEVEDIVVPFALIEDAPVFPGCENESNKKDCFNKMIQKHIAKTFRYPEIAQEMGIQGRVSVMFEIQKDGSIGNVRMRGPDKNLEKEAARIISKLPKMIPGKQRGNAVKVPFSLPITFRLQ